MPDFAVYGQIFFLRTLEKKSETSHIIQGIIYHSTFTTYLSPKKNKITKTCLTEKTRGGLGSKGFCDIPYK
jgi:hypothetical protein